MPNELIVNFELNKVTKGAVRYTEVTGDQLVEPIIGTLYIRKSGLAKLGHKSIPDKISITIQHNIWKDGVR